MSDPRTFRLQPNVHATLSGDEAVAISFLSGSYYSVQGTGALLLGLLASSPVWETAMVDALATAHAGVKREQIAEDVSRFFDALARLGIAERFVTVEPPAVISAAAVLAQGFPYGFSEITTHDELADIVTLDPIHDVGKEGWPSRA